MSEPSPDTLLRRQDALFEAYPNMNPDGRVTSAPGPICVVETRAYDSPILTHHATLVDVERYVAGTEGDGWEIAEIVDLHTGDRYDAAVETRAVITPGDERRVWPDEEHHWRVLCTSTIVETLYVTADTEEEARQKAIEGLQDDNEFGYTLDRTVNEIEEIEDE